MSRVKSLIGIFAFALLVLSVPTIASAQWGGGNRNGGYGNGGYGNGGYGGYGGDAKSIVIRLKNNTKDFVRQLDRSLDHSRINGSRREDRVNDIARDFRNAVDNLNSSDIRDYGRDNDLRRAMSLANQLEGSLRSTRDYSLQSRWNQIRQDLNRLANYDGGGYNNGRNDRNNRGNNRGNRGRNFPF